MYELDLCQNFASKFMRYIVKRVSNEVLKVPITAQYFTCLLIKVSPFTIFHLSCYYNDCNFYFIHPFIFIFRKIDLFEGLFFCVEITLMF